MSKVNEEITSFYERWAVDGVQKKIYLKDRNVITRSVKFFFGGKKKK